MHFPFSPITSSPNQLLTNLKQYCSHQDLNPASSLRSSLPSPLDRWYLASKGQKKSIFKCFNFILQGVLDLNIIFDSPKVGKLSYLLW